MIDVDLTHDASRVTLPASSLAVIAIPVYGGHLPPLAAERLRGLQGSGTPAVAVVVYGNRAYENALTELAALAGAAGLNVIAAATFVGEHSYSSDRWPIAAGRPDSDDLALAAEFGGRVAGPSGAIARGDETRTDATKCIRCCACVKSCPSHARIYDTPFASLLSKCFKRRKAPRTIL